MWRRDAEGRSVCNACGLYYKLHKVNHPHPTESLVASLDDNRLVSLISQDKDTQISQRAGMRCSNCGTGVTTLWRRSHEGEPICNACGLYYKLHKVRQVQWTMLMFFCFSWIGLLAR